MPHGAVARAGFGSQNPEPGSSSVKPLPALGGPGRGRMSRDESGAGLPMEPGAAPLSPTSSQNAAGLRATLQGQTGGLLCVGWASVSGNVLSEDSVGYGIH